MRTALATIAFLVAALPLSQSMAQTDWLKKGKDLLDSSGVTSGSGAASGSNIGGLSMNEITDGLREALKVGSQRVVEQVGQADGYNGDSSIHLPLPDSLKKVQSALKIAGMSSMLDDLELRLNRAAETAAPKARTLFLDAINEMSLEDAEKIYNGSDDAATRYFQSKMTTPLAKEMEPVVNQSLSEVGAIQSYDSVMSEYRSIPFVPDAKADLTDYVVEKGMDGIFFYLAQEEAAIRKDPLKRSTALLQKVFGAQ
jgi:hypothetical protein